MDVVDNRSDIREFLATRRAKITPEQVGLPAGGGRRRVPGLRREEVAVLAGVSPEWYARLEKGHIGGVSDSVLDAVAQALRLDEAERDHLYDLARAARPASRSSRRRTPPAVRPSVQRILDAMGTAPALVRNGRLDILAINPLGRALYSPAFEDPVRPANWPGSTSSTHARGNSTPSGTRRPTPRSPCCAPRPAATPTTASSPTWSASWRPAARSSAPGGRPTTSGCTARGPSVSTIPWSATSSWPSTRWSCPVSRG